MARHLRRPPWPRNRRRLCHALLFSATTLAALAVGSPASATTTVSGASDSSVPLTIDPTLEPSDPLTTAQREDVMFIQKLPASRTVTRVTIGDLARADFCAENAIVMGFLRESPSGAWMGNDDQQIAFSANAVSLDATLRKVTFIFPPTRLEQGRGYLLRVQVRPGGCIAAKRTTWAHNGTTVNGGTTRCQWGWAQRRMWHTQGQNDRDSQCVTDNHVETFDPSQPTGWLATRGYRGTGGGYYLANRISPLQGGEVCTDSGTAASYGIDEVFWRPYPNPPSPSYQSQYVCRYKHFAPLGSEVPDGWYYSPTAVLERDSTPRDMYLKLEYNPDDDIRTMPNCAGLLYAACEQRIRDAGFTNITRVTLTGSDIDFSLPPDGVKHTDPAAGAPTPISREIRVYANPSERDYTAWRFHPLLRFDSSEKWRPLNVEKLLAEREPTGGPRHGICNDYGGGVDCEPLLDAAAFTFSRFQDPVDYIDMLSYDGKVDEPADYRTPYACAGEGIYECELGPLAASYYHWVGSPAGYHVYDYWWFYRFNNVPPEANETSLRTLDTPLIHEGDWEGISVGVRPGGNTFDYASFSQHGTWYGYLRGNLECDDGGLLSCGGPSGSAIPPRGRRVHAFVADGTHAGYPHACDRDLVANCNTNGSPFPFETGYDGEKKWGAGTDPGTPLIQFTGGQSEPWLHWAGRWGITRARKSDWADGPSSPAYIDPTGQREYKNGEHYSAPWTMTCAPGHVGCDAAESGSSGASASSASPRECGDWFGAGVIVLACAPGELGSALAGARLDQPGEVAVSVVPRGTATVHASAPGLSQTLGDPLEVGDQIEIRGEIPADMSIWLRLVGESEPVAVALDSVARRAARRKLTLVEENGNLSVDLSGDGEALVTGDGAPPDAFGRALPNPLEVLR